MNLKELEQIVVSCRLCQRLVNYRENAPVRARFKDDEYWRRPVFGYGDPQAQLLILGLAPAADGGNRTGRIFTGDPSGSFLMQALYATGFANQPFSIGRDDHLKLHKCYMTAAVKCVPPQNRPLAKEFCNCSRYLENEFLLLKKLKFVLTLGNFAFKAYEAFLQKQSALKKKLPHFAHGSVYKIPGWPTLYASYHPSPQNTYTGRLTQQMLQSLLHKISMNLT